MSKRYAYISGPVSAVERYLPSNFRVVFTGDNGGRPFCLIVGEDVAGWTLADYVLPRLASGLYFGREVTSSEAADLL